MLRVNSELQQEHAYASRPLDWPLMKKGVAYWISDTSNVSEILCFITILVSFNLAFLYLWMEVSFCFSRSAHLVWVLVTFLCFH